MAAAQTVAFDDGSKSESTRPTTTPVAAAAVLIAMMSTESAIARVMRPA